MVDNTLHQLIYRLIPLNRHRRLHHKPEKALMHALKGYARGLVNQRLAHITLDKGHNKRFKMHDPEPKDIEQAEVELPVIINSIKGLHAQRMIIEEGVEWKEIPSHVPENEHSLWVPSPNCRKRGMKYIEKLGMLHYLDQIKPLLPTVTKLFDDHRGVSDLIYLQILAEAGLAPHKDDPDGPVMGLERFDTTAAFWKRMGVGVVGGERQRKKKDKKLALLHGYTPERHSVVWVIGQNLVLKRDPHYRPIYLARKQHELAKGWVPAHADHAARRYITKDFLKRFYKAYLTDIGHPLPYSQYSEMGAAPPSAKAA